MALERIKGDKARRYRDTITGDTVSYYAAKIKQRVQSLGYDDAHQRANVRKQFSDSKNHIKLNDAQEKMWNEARQDNFSKKKDGKLAKFLVAIGIRNPGADYDVGETPK